VNFFSGDDKRTRFKARVIERALQSLPGLQIKDETMTSFRGFYAESAEMFFRVGEVEWEQARDAWNDD
jgi:hypothetical protein